MTKRYRWRGSTPAARRSDRWKPHIYRLGDSWFCITDYFGGSGSTPTAAYEGFLMAIGVPSAPEQQEVSGGNTTQAR